MVSEPKHHLNTNKKIKLKKNKKISALCHPVENVLKLYQTNSECLWTILTFSKLVCICIHYAHKRYLQTLFSVKNKISSQIYKLGEKTLNYLLHIFLTLFKLKYFETFFLHNYQVSHLKFWTNLPRGSRVMIGNIKKQRLLLYIF